MFLSSMHTRNVQQSQYFSPDKMQKVNLFETKHFFADLYCFEPNQEQKAHAHSGADKIYFVLEGVGHFRIGNEERDAGPHQMILAPAGVEHGVKNLTLDRLLLLVFMSPNPNQGNQPHP